MYNNYMPVCIKILPIKMFIVIDLKLCALLMYFEFILLHNRYKTPIHGVIETTATV